MFSTGSCFHRAKHTSTVWCPSAVDRRYQTSYPWVITDGFFLERLEPKGKKDDERHFVPADESSST